MFTESTTMDRLLLLIYKYGNVGNNISVHK